MEDKKWHDWRPLKTTPKKEPTPETFNESLWHLADGQIEQTPTPTTPTTRSIKAYSFEHAPELVRNAWIDTEEDNLYPSPIPKTESPFSFARMTPNKKPEGGAKPFGENKKTSNQANASQKPNNMAIIRPPRSIPPNGIAPIGSEVAALKQSPANRTQSKRIEDANEEDSDDNGTPEVAAIYQPGKIGSNNHSSKENEAFKTPEQLMSSTTLSIASLEGTSDDTDSGDETQFEQMSKCVSGTSMKKLSEKEGTKNAAKSNSAVRNKSSGGVKLPKEASDTTLNPTWTATLSHRSRKMSSSSTSSTATITPSRQQRIESKSSSLSASSTVYDASLSNVSLAQLQAGAFLKSDGHSRTGSQDSVASFASGSSEIFQLAQDKASGAGGKSRGGNLAVAPRVGGAAAPPLAVARGGAALAAPAGFAQLALSPRFSAEDMVSAQMSAAHDAQVQLAASFDERFLEMRRQHQAELAKKDRELADVKKENRALRRKHDEHGKKFLQLQENLSLVHQTLAEVRAEQNSLAQKKGKQVAYDVTPQNQVAFQEPATSMPSPCQQFVVDPNNATPCHLAIIQHPAPSTYPGANPPSPYTGYNTYYNSPEYVMQPHPAPATMSGNPNAGPSQALVTANPADDVFGDPFGERGPGLQHFFATIGFEQRGMSEAFNDCFSRVEGSLRMTPMVSLHTRPRSDQAAQTLLTKCQEHIMHRPEALNLLAHPEEKYFMMTGITNSLIVKHVFQADFLMHFNCIYQADVVHWYSQENHTFQNDLTNVEKRMYLGKQRAEAVNLAIQTSGFWNWAHHFTNLALDKIMHDIQAAFNPAYLPTLRTNLWHPVNDAVHLAVRIAQDPRYYTFSFPKVGCVWDNKFMIQRNPELVGQEIGNVRTPYVTRCTARPLVKVKVVNHDDLNGKVIYKGEVLISERNNGLRPWRRPGRYRRRN